MKLVTREQKVRKEIKNEWSMKQNEIVQRLNRMCVDYMKRSALAYNLADGLNNREQEVLAEEYKKNAIALNRAELMIYGEKSYVTNVAECD